MDSLEIERFIEESNAFEVMGELKRLGLLNGEDIKQAMQMDREGWVRFMKEKAGLFNGEDDL